MLTKRSFTKLIQQGRWEDALLAMESQPEAHQDDTYRLLKANVLWRMGQYERALASYKDAHHTNASPQTAAALISALLAMAQLEDAVDLILAESERHPDVRHFCMLQMLAHLHRHNDQAVDRISAKLLADFETIDDAAIRATLIRKYRNLPIPESGHQKVANDPAGQIALASADAIANLAPDPHWVAWPTQVLIDALSHTPEDGLLLEFGVFQGRSINLIAARTNRRVFGFDSFEGLPEDWTANSPKGAYSLGGRLPDTAENVSLIPGWFSDAIPQFAKSHAGPVALLHLDCDLHSSTALVLESLGERLPPGAVVILDDFVGYPGFLEHEYRAWNEFCTKAGVEAQLISAAIGAREAAFQIIENPTSIY